MGACCSSPTNESMPAGKAGPVSTSAVPQRQMPAPDHSWQQLGGYPAPHITPHPGPAMVQQGGTMQPMMVHGTPSGQPVFVQGTHMGQPVMVQQQPVIVQHHHHHGGGMHGRRMGGPGLVGGMLIGRAMGRQQMARRMGRRR